LSFGSPLFLSNRADSLATSFANSCKHTDNETNIKDEATTLSIRDIAIELEEPRKTCRWAAVCSRLYLQHKDLVTNVTLCWSY